ncbi:hypothetical protein [Streptomyces sp. SID5785]|uniref:hypothetical protein n=1 Tax=Streptomyces sp. SID5785 TaxID=2690309 RepID=UPI001F2A16C2|nr:hypothetical protein [Streptomyces sp. SID5785]
MSEQWGNVVAALIAAVAALVGVRMGLRQVADGAHIEHEQWLRGQRQEAYVVHLDAVDHARAQLADIINSADRYEEATNEGHEWSDIGEDIDRCGEEICNSVRKLLERVYLLGPEKVHAAAVELDHRLTELKLVVRIPEEGVRSPNYELYRTTEDSLESARRGFLTVTQQVLGTAPQPSRGRSWRRR